MFLFFTQNTEWYYIKSSILGKITIVKSNFFAEGVLYKQN